MPRVRLFTTAKPSITDAQLTRIRTLAHRYLLAGGGLVVPADTDLNEYIAVVRKAWRPSVEKTFDTALDRALPSDSDAHDAHTDVWTATWNLVGIEGESGFLFGVAVGLEVAALTVRGELPRVQTPKKGGRR